MSNLIKVYSPSGEVFENSPANARDLVVHAGWSYSPLSNTIKENEEEKLEGEEDETESEASNGEEEQSEEVTPLRGRRKKVQ